MTQQLNLLGEPDAEKPRAPRQDAVLELLQRPIEGAVEVIASNLAREAAV